jgi:c-di-GMP-binding flagellar brake protein YcgR
MNERRAHVRVRPAVDYDVRVELRDGVVGVGLAVIDISVGGMGLVVDELFQDKRSGDMLRLQITLPGAPTFQTQAEIRYSSRTVGGKCGVSLSHLSVDEQHRLSRAVAELLERGHSA